MRSGCSGELLRDHGWIGNLLRVICMLTSSPRSLDEQPQLFLWRCHKSLVSWGAVQGVAAQPRQDQIYRCDTASPAAPHVVHVYMNRESLPALNGSIALK